MLRPAVPTKYFGGTPVSCRRAGCPSRPAGKKLSSGCGGLFLCAIRVSGNKIRWRKGPGGEYQEPTPANGTSDERVTTVPVTLCESPTVCFQKKEAVPGSLGATDAGTAF